MCRSCNGSATATPERCLLNSADQPALSLHSELDLALQLAEQSARSAPVITRHKLGQRTLIEQVILAKDVVVERGDMLEPHATHNGGSGLIAVLGIGRDLVETTIVPVLDEGPHGGNAQR